MTAPARARSTRRACSSSNSALSFSSVSSNPCGYCGGPAVDKCEPMIKETAKSLTCIINCPRKEVLQYGTAAKGSVTTRCRNVPVVCRLCIHSGQGTDERPAIWRYNTEAHISERHREYSHPGKPHGLLLPHVVFDSLALTPLEEEKANVPAREVFTHIVEKENDAPSGSRSAKRKGNGERAGTAKKGRK